VIDKIGKAFSLWPLRATRVLARR